MEKLPELLEDTEVHSIPLDHHIITGAGSRLIRHFPPKKESAITSPLNTISELLSEEELEERNRALQVINRKRRFPAPRNIIVN